jgi:hypothetical protein
MLHNDILRALKHNAFKVKKAIESSEILKQRRAWDEAVVVFSNENVMLRLNNPTVPVLRTNQLLNYLTSRKLNYSLAPQEVNMLGEHILKQLR